MAGLACHDFGALNCAITGLGNAIQAITGQMPPSCAQVVGSPDVASGAYHRNGIAERVKHCKPYFDWKGDGT
jgi:hypothetical protein